MSPVIALLMEFVKEKTTESINNKKCMCTHAIYMQIIKCINPLPKMHVMLDFICIGSVELSGTHGKQNYLKLTWTLMFHWRRQPYFF